MVILASSSPRRQELLKEIIPNFKIVKPTFDEKTVSLNHENYAGFLSLQKALSIKNLANPQDLIISADTIVVKNGHIFNKPIDKNDAFNMLKKLVNSEHEVITGFTIIYNEKIATKEVSSKVYFNDFNDADILDYIENVYVLDKAGAYAIQDDEKLKKPLINKINGSYNNVVGLPTEALREVLNELHFF